MRYSFILAILGLSLFIAGCSETEKSSSGGDNTNAAENQSEDVTIKWAHPWGEEYFQETIADKVNDQFPHITVEFMEGDVGNPESLENQMVAGNIPDIVSLISISHLSALDDLGLAYNMDDVIEEANFELERLEPSVVEYTRNQDPNMEGGLYAIPENRPTWVLHYNKDVFDILGVNYPEDGMTWEEVYELAIDLTREVGGVQYRGLDLDLPHDAFTQFSVNTVDPETNEVEIANNEAVRRYLEYIQNVVSIPGNYPSEEPSSLLHNWGTLMEEGNIAMAPAKTNGPWMTGMPNVDIVTYPVWEGYEGLNPVPDGRAWAITEPSKHKKEALEVIEYLLSDEVQMERSRQGGESILADPKIHEDFAVDNPDLQGKHLESLFINEYAVGPAKKAKYADDVLWEAPLEFVDSGKDINEFLRILQEEAEANVQTQMGSE